MPTDYDAIRAAVEAAFVTAGASMRADYIGETSRDAWQCDEWRIVMMRGDKVREEFEYFTGLGHRKAVELFREPRPVTPHVADVLHSLILDSSATSEPFADWCSNYGYSEDSRKALDTYLACQKSAKRLRRVLPDPTTRETIGAMLQDY